jgi:hypothetical protein
MFNYRISIENNNGRTTIESNDVNEYQNLIDSYTDKSIIDNLKEGEYIEVTLRNNATDEIYFFYTVEVTSREVRTSTYKSDFYREYFC